MSTFQVDFHATAPRANHDTELVLLGECKYHDNSRFWFFHPHQAHRWHFNDRFFNVGPVQTLKDERSNSSLGLAPLSYWGVVVSEDGQKQDNAIATAIQQLAFSFTQFSLEHFTYLADPDLVACAAIVPIIVTNARMFRMKPDVSALETIRAAKRPEDIADELQWTWCYNEPSWDVEEAAEQLIAASNKAPFVRIPSYAEPRVFSWTGRPNWFAICNINSLAKAAQEIQEHFLKLEVSPASVARRKAIRASQ